MTADSNAPPGGRWEWSGHLVLVSILALTALVLLGRPLVDPDLFGRIAYARDAFAQGAWTWHTDPYSYTVPGGRWMDHEWGFSWVSYFVFRLAGWPGIAVLQLTLMVGTACLCLVPTLGVPGARRLRPALTLALAPALALAFVGPRAQGFTFLLCAWMLMCFARSWVDGPRWFVWAVLPMPLWVNLHGGFVAGLAIAALWLGVRLFAALKQRNRDAMRWIAAAFAWSVFSLFLQPWGWNYVLLIIRDGTMPREFVPEWGAPALFGPHWTVGVLFIGLAALSLRAPVRRWPDLAVMAVLAIPPFLHRRHLTFFVIAVAVFAFPALSLAWHQWRPPPRAARRTLLSRTAAAALLLLTVFLVWKTGQVVRQVAPSQPPLPVEAVRHLKERGCGNVLVDFEWAQYLIFEAAPACRVAADGRYEEVYPHDVMQRYIAWYFGFVEWQALPMDPATRYVLVASQSDRARRLETLVPAWRLVYADQTASVYEKPMPGLANPP